MEAESATAAPSIVESPERSGVLLGLFAVLVQEFFYTFDLAGLSVGFIIVGFLLALWADEWWPAIGRALVVVGATALLATRIYHLV